MITTQQETLDVILPQVKDLLDQHYDELTMNKERVKLDPWFDEYLRLEASKQFFTVTARDNGELIGYSSFIVKPHLHYRTITVATSDVMFLKKEYRTSSTAGLKLIKQSIEMIKSMGINKIVFRIKDSNDFSPILLRYGFHLEDRIYSKFLD